VHYFCLLSTPQWSYAIKTFREGDLWESTPCALINQVLRELIPKPPRERDLEELLEYRSKATVSLGQLLLVAACPEHEVDVTRCPCLNRETS
jgi:hypothetical protein